MPELVEIKITYSVGHKASKNYQSTDIHLSESESYSVGDLDPDAAQSFSDERYAALKDKVDARLVEAFNELKTA